MINHRSYTLNELQERICNEIEEFGSARKLADFYGMNSGLVTHVLSGKESPTLRRSMHAPKSEPRIRLIIELKDRATIARFDAACKERGMSRADALEWCVDKLEET